MSHLFPKGFIPEEKPTHQDCGKVDLNSLGIKGKAQASICIWVLKTFFQPFPKTVSRSSRKFKRESNKSRFCG